MLRSVGFASIRLKASRPVPAPRPRPRMSRSSSPRSSKVSSRISLVIIKSRCSIPIHIRFLVNGSRINCRLLWFLDLLDISLPKYGASPLYGSAKLMEVSCSSSLPQKTTTNGQLLPTFFLISALSSRPSVHICIIVLRTPYRPSMPSGIQPLLSIVAWMTTLQLARNSIMSREKNGSMRYCAHALILLEFKRRYPNHFYDHHRGRRINGRRQP